MFASGRGKFRAQYVPIGFIAIDTQDTCSLGHDLGSSLIIKARFPNGNVTIFQRSERLSDYCDIGLGENDQEWRPALETMRVFLNAIKASDAPFVRGLMQHGMIGIGIARDKNRQVSHLHGRWVIGRKAPVIERQSEVF